MEETEAQTPENPGSEVPTDSARIQAAMAAMQSSSSPPEEAEPAEETEPPVEAAPAEEPEEEKESPPLTPGEENVAAESTGLASLARRERRQREQSKEREAKFTAKEKELEAKLRSASELEAKLAALKSDMLSDPVNAMKNLGIEDGYADLATALYDEELGEDSPDEWKEQRATRDLSARIRRLEKEQKDAEQTLQKERQQTEFESFQRNYLNEMDGYMREVPTEFTYAKALYGSNPTEAVQAMYGIAYGIAQEDPNADLPAPNALAEALNLNLQETLGPIINAVLAERKGNEDETQAARGTIRAAPKTLRNAQSSRTAKRPPARTDEERVQRALQALMNAGVG